ncbi:MAG: zinc-ribbon domain-containing protein [Alphaproteobacteria bacterium]|nr:zinc-ribbon domain-containing protein [Alphaproteobacteria bacterium]
MLISCPKCKTVYMVNAEQIPDSGKKFKCFNCEHIWEVFPQDLIPTESEKSANLVKPQIIRPAVAVDNSDQNVQQMFEKMSKDTKSLFSYDDNAFNKIRRKLQVFLTPLMRNSIIFIFIFCFTFLIGYFNRYDAVRFVPQMKYFYDELQLESLYKGRDVVFRMMNVEHLDKRDENFVEISGILTNKGKYKVELPPIKFALINKNGTVEDSIVKKMTMPQLDAGMSSMFRVLLRNTTIDEKQVKINFCKDIESCEDAETVAGRKAIEAEQQKQINNLYKQRNYRK